jgi:hypothetical protein
MVEVIATAVLQRCRLELRAGYVLRLEKLPTLSPGNGMPVVVRERRSIAPGVEPTTPAAAPTVA